MQHLLALLVVAMATVISLSEQSPAVMGRLRNNGVSFDAMAQDLQAQHEQASSNTNHHHNQNQAIVNSNSQEDSHRERLLTARQSDQQSPNHLDISPRVIK